MKVDISDYPDDNFRQWKRDIKVEISDHDVWSADNTLSHIILPILLKVKEMKQSIPYTNKDDCPIDFGKDQGYNEKRWNWILDEMIFAFGETVKGDWEDQYYSGEMDMVSVPLNKDLSEEDENQIFEWKPGPNHTFKVDKEGLKAHQERIQNGFNLFGKYFTSLWV